MDKRGFSPERRELVFALSLLFLGAALRLLGLGFFPPGLNQDEASTGCDAWGLLVSGIIVSALGAVMDVAMSISSALEEVHAANPALKQNDLFKSGMNIGRDMVGTMTNTLILAFLGCEFTLILFLYTRELTFYHLFSTAFVAIETISGLASSLGMILAIPLTALISSTLITRKKRK